MIRESIVINVSGSAIQFPNSINFSEDNSLRGKIVWNFHEATSMEMQQKQFPGALLAPLADVTNPGSIKGSCAVKSIVTLSSLETPTLSTSYGDSAWCQAVECL